MGHCCFQGNGNKAVQLTAGGTEQGPWIHYEKKICGIQLGWHWYFWATFERNGLFLDT